MNNVDNLYELNLSGANGNEIRKAINHLGAINFVIPIPRETYLHFPSYIYDDIVNSLDSVIKGSVI